MELKTYTPLDTSGNVIPNASVTVYAAGTNNLATLFDKNNAALSNPFSADSNGVAAFRAADGLYELVFGIGPVDGPRIPIQFLDFNSQIQSINNALAQVILLRQQVDEINNNATYADVATGMSFTGVGMVFRVVSPAGTASGFTYYRKVNQNTSQVLAITPNAQQVQALTDNLQRKLDAYKFTDVVQDISNHDDVAFAVRDIQGNPSWLMVDAVTGGPTEHSMNWIGSKIGMLDYPGTAQIAAGVEELALAFVDAGFKASDLAIRAEDGQLANFVVDRLAKRIAVRLGLDANGLQAALNGVHIRNDHPQPQLLNSIARWIGAGPTGRAVATPQNFSTATYAQSARLNLINNYNGNEGLLLCLYFGGVNSNTDLTPPGDYFNMIAEGVIFARCNYHGNHYGQPQAIQDAIDVYNYACSILPISGVLLLGNSMGAMLALNCLTTGAIPGVVGLYLTDPVANLGDRYNSERQAMIQAAYGINADGSNYSTQTAGYDPILRNWSDYRGLPIYCVASTGDTLVPFATNAKMLSDKLSAHNDFTLIDMGTPGHNSADRFDIARLRAFVRKVCQGRVLKA